MTESATYDIAVSFAEEQRAVVGEVVEACRQRGLTVLEDNDLPEARVRFFVPFVSSVDELAVNGDEHVLPVLTGDAPAPSSFLRTDDGLVDALVSRVEAAETAGRERVSVAEMATTAETEQPATTSPLRSLAEQFAAGAKRDLTGTLHLGDTTIAVRVERAGDTVYAVEVRDDTVNFVVLGGTTELLSTLHQRIEDMLAS
ncbi:hypothetical protein SAMN04488074_123103 [Lentzea albidocapillata subsp. violacea]|uniref:Uncharacterized protein n=1 Tax=Lentzea albidocapillata subsp. violacea TaxID=128104 RepID=A0A1G9UAC7_9PSEU|nr:hypothetical protein [Lentzea albidocapillata]SDM56772.1 hypothetical protein SAMN04488074_123103 [Lentzea albidocapillata subsp. violacea]